MLPTACNALQLFMLSNLFAEHVDVLHALLHDKIDEVPAISVEFDEGCRLLRVDGKARLDHFLRVVRTDFQLGFAGCRRRHGWHVDSAARRLLPGDVVGRAALATHPTAQQLGHDDIPVKFDIHNSGWGMHSAAMRLERRGLSGGPRKAVENEATAPARRRRSDESKSLLLTRRSCWRRDSASSKACAADAAARRPVSASDTIFEQLS